MRYPVAAMDIEVYTSGIACIALKPENNSGVVFKDRSGPMPKNKIIKAIRAIQRLIDKGYWIVTWNGLGFDYKELVIAVNDDNWANLISQLAIQQIDIMYNFLCGVGFPASLENVSKAMGFGGKHIKNRTIGQLWHGSETDQNQVIEYVERDVRATIEIYDLIMKRRGQIVWTTRAGKKSVRYLPMIMINNEPARLMNAAEAITLPALNMDWWNEGDPPDKRENFGWFATQLNS